MTLVLVALVAAGCSSEGRVQLRAERTTVPATTVIDLVAAQPDGTTTESITERLGPDDIRTYRSRYSDYRHLVVEFGDALQTHEVDADGDGIDEDDPPAETDVITLTISRYDPAVGGDAPDDDRYTLSFVPQAGGFAGPDPTAIVVDALRDEFTKFGVVAGTAVDFVVESETHVDASIDCPSGQFKPPAGGPPVDPDANADEYGYQPELWVDAGAERGTSTTRLAPTTTDICTVYVEVDDEVDLPESAWNGTIDATVRLIPVAP